jgi:quinol monooxygenase YgiN
MSHEVHLIAHLVPKPGQEAALAEGMAAIIPQVIKEPGCIAYVAHESRDAPGTIVMIETWADQAALDAHGKAPAINSLAARFDELLGEPVRIELLRRI